MSDWTIKHIAPEWGGGWEIYFDDNASPELSSKDADAVLSLLKDVDKLADQRNAAEIYTSTIERLLAEATVENATLRAAVKLCWDALDSLYGGDAFEALPIEVMTPDRRNACNAALEAIGALEI